jgi:hypothetical protein
MNLLPGLAEIIIHTAIDINRFGRENMAELINETREAIGAGLR